jgi:chloramphenicol-sensitive protein RarD
VNDSGKGVAYAVAAYGFWGLTPVYWKALQAVAPPALLGYRILWSCAFGVALVSARRAWPELRRCLVSRRHGIPIFAAALLLAVNWLTFLWAIATDRVLATSLGYYVTPLVNVALGVVFLGERLSRTQLAALGLASAGVLVLALQVGETPWIPLALAASFGAYGLVRKAAPVGPIAGFGLEMLLLAPCAAAYLLASGARGAVLPDAGPGVRVLVAASGIVTAVPLLWFNRAARDLRLATLGFFQYLAPSIGFALAVFAYGERFTPAHAVCFGCVWTALAITSLEALHATGWGRR